MMSPSTKSVPEPLTRKLSRIVLLVLFLQAGSLLVVGRFVRAQVDDMLLSAGSSMMQLGERMGAQTPRTVVLNGAELRLRVGTAQGLTLAQVLDTFERRCRARDGQFHEQLGRAEVLSALTDAQRARFDGVLRTEKDGHGAVACLDVGDKALDAAALAIRLQTFARTGDVSSVGGLRFMRAETQPDGSVLLVMLWSEGPLNLKRMFPSTGDAPGIDFTGIPRPQDSRRLLSAWEQGQAPALNLYATQAKDTASIEAYYRDVMRRSGFRLLTANAPKSKRALRGMFFEKDGRTLVLAATRTRDGKILVSLVPTDTRGDTKSPPG